MRFDSIAVSLKDILWLISAAATAGCLALATLFCKELSFAAAEKLIDLYTATTCVALRHLRLQLNVQYRVTNQ